jgi:tripartite-type tricarboxylate transporter receptor subunit TctC
VGATAVAQATDGHTLLFTTDATFTINPFLYAKLPYGLKDFAPVTMAVSFSQFLVANARFAADSVPQLIELAKAQPGMFSYASYGPGSQPHLAMEMFKSKAGVNIVHVPYRGLPPALQAVLANEVPLTWMAESVVREHIRAGRLKALAYAGKQRSPHNPETPTFAELGFPEVDAGVWMGVFAPAGMPAAQVEQINKDIRSILNEPQFRNAQIIDRGYELEGRGPAEFLQLIQAELRTREELVKISGARVD